jgi:hypothetical protein
MNTSLNENFFENILNNQRNDISKREDEDSDVPALSAEALKALKEFYAEREENEKSNNLEENWV